VHLLDEYNKTFLKWNIGQSSTTYLGSTAVDPMHSSQIFFIFFSRTLHNVGESLLEEFHLVRSLQVQFGIRSATPFAPYETILYLAAIIFDTKYR
jgi:hypothetical protein